GGDFNAVLDTDLDRSTPPLQGATSTKTAKKLVGWLDAWGLVDAWRLQHPATRDYSFYSGLHQVHTRIDRIVCTAGLARRVTHAEYL
ncbi:hypothetical protein NDU88_003685, partial [Pleurodeles waltl]